MPDPRNHRVLWLLFRLMGAADTWQYPFEDPDARRVDELAAWFGLTALLMVLSAIVLGVTVEVWRTWA